jgi:hypothetical protein
LEPYIVDGAIPAVVHEVAVPAGGATAGNGLTPGEAISVAPSGIPVPPTPMLGPMPSGEVAPSVGVGTAIPVTCAIAGPLAKNNTQAVISELFTCISDQKIRGWPGSAAKSFWAGVRRAHALAAAQWQGLAGMQAIPVVAVQAVVVEISGRISPEVVHRVLMQASIKATGVIAEAEVLPAQMPDAVRHRNAAGMHTFADASDVR